MYDFPVAKILFFSILQQSVADPEHRGLSVGVSVHPGTGKIVVPAVESAGAYAHIGDVAVFVKHTAEFDPGFPGGRSVGLLVKPSVLDSL